MTTTVIADETDHEVKDHPMLIGGHLSAASGGQWSTVLSPGRRGTQLGRVPQAEPSDVDRAVAAARAALPGWRSLHFRDRSVALLRIADALEERAEELARLTAADTGNALRTQPGRRSGP